MKQNYKVAIGDIKFGKKTTIALEIKGDLSDEQKLALLEFAQSDGFIQLATAQRDIDDYAVKTPAHVGIGYKVDKGEIIVDPEQLNIEDVIKDDIHPDNDAIVESIMNGHDLADSVREANEENAEEIRAPWENEDPVSEDKSGLADELE